MTKSETQTRSELIDQQLALSSWNVKDPTQVVEEFDILTSLPEGVAEPRTPYEGHQFSDYVLLGKDRKPLAVIEAKKSSRDAAVGREQAKQYCYNIQKQLSGELPFCFYTNGHETYFWDLENAPPRKVVGFPTRDDLERFAYIRRNRKPLTQEFINTSIAGRDYQIRAIRSVLEGIEQKKRDFLLVMATGTGKTRTCSGQPSNLNALACSRVNRPHVHFTSPQIASSPRVASILQSHRGAAAGTSMASCPPSRRDPMRACTSVPPPQPLPEPHGY